MREAYLDCFTFVHRTYQPYYRLARTIAEWSGDTNKILDLGSGGAEHVFALLQAYKKLGIAPPQFVLSDLYPNVDAYAKLQKKFGDNAVTYINYPVSALNIEGTDIRYWSIFTAFHHFAPADARQLLQQLFLKGDGLCILEYTQRSVYQLVMMICGFPLLLLVPFFARKFRLRKMLFTTIIPVIPLMAIFDGIVSILRSYTKEEILALMPPDSRDAFHVDYKEVMWRFAPLKATMFMLKRKH